MIQIPRWKIYTSIVVCLIGILLAMPNILPSQVFSYLPSWMQKTINLGLELRGGSHLQLEVDFKTVNKEQMTTLLDEVRTVLRKEQIGYTGLLVVPVGEGNQFKNAVQIALKELTQKEKAEKAIRKIDPELDVQMGADGKMMVTYSDQAIDRKIRSVIGQSIEVVRRRVDESGTKEPIIQRQGQDRIILQLPGVDDPGEVKTLLGRTAKMSFRLIDPNAETITINDKGVPSSPVPFGSEILPEIRTNKKGQEQILYHVVKKQVMVSGETLIDAQATTDNNGQPVVAMTFNSIGAKKFALMSTQNLKKQFAIVLDDKVISAPVFESPIPDGKGQISGRFTFKEANDLALLLRAGALPAPLKVIEEKTVGPTLGADSIRSGQIATILAVTLVAIFMLLNYSMFGIFADIALIFNLIFLIAALSLLQATLTLPGIAGIALTVGMAVDANVLIYERIKEELRAGVKSVIAIEAGYKRALTTIIDSNLTTLIGAAVLFEFGSGPIRGFAVTLALGILISMFTALSLTRIIIVMWLKNRRIQTLPI
ncbi:MAG: protein translocase subunit SecD [Proteobacteria bacterium]|nr:protein translocase subunit SecD [Pseudomonadota bacterium]